MAGKVMKAQDAINGALAECYVTIGTNRYNFMQLIKFEAKVDKTKSEVPILGKTGKGNKSNGWKGTFTGTAHYNQSIMRKLLLEYMKTGLDTYFDIQVTNNDPASAAGKQTVIFTGCNLDGGTLAKFDVDAEYLDEEVSGTFEDARMKDSFKVLSGMK